MILDSAKNRLRDRANVKLVVTAQPRVAVHYSPTNPPGQEFSANFVVRQAGLIAPNKYPDSTANSNRCGIQSFCRFTWVSVVPAKICEQTRETIAQRESASVFIRRAYDRNA